MKIKGIFKDKFKERTLDGKFEVESEVWGYNQALDEIGELEVFLDKEEVADKLRDKIIDWLRLVPRTDTTKKKII